MSQPSPELLEKVRQQFDFGPYPRIPVETVPDDNLQLLFDHCLVTPYYLQYQKVVETTGKVILDAGCGTGYKSLVLAKANPGAKIVGVDLSKESIELAKKRLEFHGINNAEFHVLTIDELPSLGMEFDYINCDEVLYLLPDGVEALKVMKSVLAPQGILRTNLHSKVQRAGFYRAQQLFKLMGLMDSNPEDFEIELAIETMKALKDRIDLKMKAWSPDFIKDDPKQFVLANYLLQEDKGSTVAEMFAMLENADLALVSMVNWRQWEIMDLFQNTDDLPAFWQLSLPEIPVDQRLQLFELIHPVHRLLDFWCTHPDQEVAPVSIAQWEPSDWQNVMVTLHPILRTEKVKADLINAVKNQCGFEITQYVPKASLSPMILSSNLAACLLPLWEGKQSISSLVERYLSIRPLDPITLQPISEEEATKSLRNFLGMLEMTIYILLEPSV